MQAASLQYWLALKTEDGLRTAATFFCFFVAGLFITTGF